MLTEKEARERWCPFSRLVAMDGDITHAGAPTGYNRPDSKTLGIPSSANCIGSLCMAWRWSQMEEDVRYFRSTAGIRCEGGDDDETPLIEPARPADVEDWMFWNGGEYEHLRIGWHESDDHFRARSRGYCGLAGRHE